ncbi:MAG: response regulator [Planctomycetaceae bacterium]
MFPAETEHLDDALPIGRHILFADDDPVSRLLTTRILQSLGHTVVAVADGSEAVATAEREAFDLMLLDIRMPILGGLEAAALLRQRGHTCPIFGLTGSVRCVSEVDFLASGMQGCFPKPLRVETFTTLLATHLPTPVQASN